MIRVALDLENPEDLRSAKAEWKFAPGLVPGEDNEGLVARLIGSPARLADYDDSGWGTQVPVTVAVGPVEGGGRGCGTTRWKSVQWQQEVGREHLPLWTVLSYNRRHPSPPASREGTRSACRDYTISG